MSDHTDADVQYSIILACADLMTGTNIAVSSAHGPTVLRTPADVVTAVHDHGASIDAIVIDLQTMGDLARQLREDAGYGGVIIGFAPHVQVEMLQAARPFVNKLQARGAVIQRFDEIVADGMQRAARSDS